MTKPLHIEGFTQTQRNSWVRAASKAGMKLNDWVAQACDAHVNVNHWPRTLPPNMTDEDFKPLPHDDFVPPEWCNGLSHRVAVCLVIHGEYTSREQVQNDWNTKNADCFMTLPNFGNKCLMELNTWLNN